MTYYTRLSGGVQEAETNIAMFCVLGGGWLDIARRSSTMRSMAMIGVLNVNKPAGMTSRAAVDRVERLVRPAKVGHAGTLDPLAIGVLVICVGQATRLIQYVQRMAKCYHATFRLGVWSDTDDVEGKVVPMEGAVAPGRDLLDRVLTRFVGEIQQRPPAHSAIKLAGKRAYQLARRGVEVELRPRPVMIYELAVRRYEYPELELDVKCGSGTYIRSLGRDIGAALGTGAVMTALERTAVGGFGVGEAIAVEELSTELVQQNLQPAIVAVAELPRVLVTDAQQFELRNGRPILASWLKNVPASDGAREIAAVDRNGLLAAILYEKLCGEFWPAHNFEV